MTFTMICAVILVAVALAVAVFQVCLACGAPWGAYAFGGSHAGVLPRRYRFMSAFSLLVSLAQAAVFASVAGLVSPWIPSVVLPWILWLFVGFFALGTLMNAISRSARERNTWTPIVAISLLCALVVALTL